MPTELEIAAALIDLAASPPMTSGMVSAKHAALVLARMRELDLTADQPRQPVYLAQRDTALDGLYGFADETDRDAYATLFEGADTGVLTVLDRAAAAALIAGICPGCRESRDDCECPPITFTATDGPGAVRVDGQVRIGASPLYRLDGPAGVVEFRRVADLAEAVYHSRVPLPGFDGSSERCLSVDFPCYGEVAKLAGDDLEAYLSGDTDRIQTRMHAAYTRTFDNATEG